MKTILILLSCNLFSIRSFSQSQAQMNQQADAAYRKADQELNRTYQQILKDYRTKTVFLQSLKAAQQRWIQFRDAEMKARYPAANSLVEYGSFFPVCYSNGLEELTKARTRQLRVWLTGIPEGDMCKGSVKVAGSK
ncbi:lysozyme inhibitor LprI family protein [Hymenobacter baengnokdamensis]|uniref:lysozyme inhibitor LprI family protein n=1 Tax=Hymenobacter baengnokdamensis TaxID=2615203 RepID=UPI0012487A31|nr:lysozyme inhibitor LprI family protein [Hymenobacter baengnokdamensis]